MKKKNTGPRKIENQHVSRLPAYEPMRLNGWIILNDERMKVKLSRTVKTLPDHLPLTSARIAELAAEQGVRCTVTEYTAEVNERPSAPVESEE